MRKIAKLKASKNIKKIDKPLGSETAKKREKINSPISGMKNGSSGQNLFNELIRKWLIRNNYKLLHVKKFDNLDEINKFTEKYNLYKLIQFIQ